MSRKTKWLLLLATVLVLGGCLLFGGVMMALNWKFSKLSTVKWETNEHAVSGFENITVLSDTANVTISPSATGEYGVVLREQENATHTVTVENGTLKVELNRTRKWYENIGLSFGVPRITVTVPQQEYGKISVAVTTGKVSITGLTCTEDVNISATTGNVRLADITCKNLTAEGTTGNLTASNVVAAEKFLVRRTTGDIRLDGCDGGALFIKTNTGNVKGTLRTEKVFTANTTTGKISLPPSGTGGKCEISTTTGDIKLRVQ